MTMTGCPMRPRPQRRLRPLLALVLMAAAATLSGLTYAAPHADTDAGPAAPHWADKIKHIVVLMEENRSFDHLFGWATKLLKVNGLTGKESNLVNRSAFAK